MKRTYILFLFVLLFLSPTKMALSKDYNAAQVDYFLNYQDCPIQITEWAVYYQEEGVEDISTLIGTLPSSIPVSRPAKIQFKFIANNVSDNEIMAYKVNVIVFNPFEEYLDTFSIFNSYSYKPGKDISDSGSVIFDNANEFMTFFIWIDKARDKKGNLYFADLNNIKNAIKEKIGIDMPLELLEVDPVKDINSKARLKKHVLIKENE
jgi:hypothetical protein